MQTASSMRDQNEQKKNSMQQQNLMQLQILGKAPQQYEIETKQIYQHKNQSIMHGDDQLLDKTYEPSFYMKSFFSYLYFTQGLVIAFTMTMPYIYSQLPNYNIMALFSAALLPYSFKFLIAPFLQKFTSIQYGKRKFWIVISQILSAVSIFTASFFTKNEQSSIIAFIYLLSNLFMTLQDISLDSLARKQLRIPSVISVLSSTSQIVGILLGSMLLLKLTSIQFALILSFKSQISSPATILRIFGIIIVVPCAIIHLKFKQTILRSQHESIFHPICKIIQSYKIFFIWKSKYFRTALFLLIVQQGFNFFNAGYQYELIRAGFSRDVNNTIQNLVIIPVSIVTCLFTQKLSYLGIKTSLMISMSIQMIIFSLLRIFFPLNVYVIGLSTLLLNLLDNWRFLIGSILIFDFPVHGYSGMNITFLASASNLGATLTLHTKILYWTNWWLMSWVGLFIQFLILLALYFYIIDWKDDSTQNLKEILSVNQFNEVMELQQDSSG